jgi:hypothetical protein
MIRTAFRASGGGLCKLLAATGGKATQARCQKPSPPHRVGVISRSRLCLSYQRTDTSPPVAERVGESLADTFDVLLDMEWSGSDYRSIKVLGRCERGKRKGLAATCSGVQVAARHQLDRCRVSDHYTGPL